jgi:hypothetical protein
MSKVKNPLGKWHEGRKIYDFLQNDGVVTWLDDEDAWLARIGYGGKEACHWNYEGKDFIAVFQDSNCLTYAHVMQVSDPFSARPMVHANAFVKRRGKVPTMRMVYRSMQKR